MAVRVRHPQPGDGAGIARVHVETWQAAYAGLLPADYLDRLTADLDRRTAWWERQIGEAAHRRWIQIIAEDEAGIVGFITCGPVESELADPWVAQVYAIYVLPRAWSTGVGRELLAQAVELLRRVGFQAAILWVLESNARARRFYEIAGWHPDGAKKSETRGDVVLNEVRYRTEIPPSADTFPRNTYVVLDVPPPAADEILALRERERDFFRWSLPAETTLIGSSGTGSIVTSEDPARVFATLDKVAAATAPIAATLGPVRRFPNSDVFYFSFEDERLLRGLHERLSSSGLRFGESAFQFVPHITLRTRSPVTEDEARQLLAIRLSSKFVLDTLSLYQLVWRQPPDRFATLLCLLHRVRLTGAR